MSSQSRASLNWSLVVLASFLLQVVPAQGQNFVWAKQMGGPPFSNQAWGVAVDASGNVYTTGEFRGTADFDPGPGVFNLTSLGPAVGSGTPNIFVSKLDSAGNFVWARQMGGVDRANAFGIALDGSGNVYTTGRFLGTVDFDPGPGTFNLTSISSINLGDIFVSKLDSAGNFVWAMQVGGDLGYGWDVALDVSGNVYTTGVFRGTSDFDPGPGVFNLTSGAVSDIFVSKLDSVGNFVWAKKMGGGSTQFPMGVAVDVSGNVYTTGLFLVSPTDFDPGPGVFSLTPAESSDIFVSKLDSAGNFVWAVEMGGGFAVESRVVVDGSDNVYTTGTFIKSFDFDPGPNTFILTSAGGADIFVSKLGPCTSGPPPRPLPGAGRPPCSGP